MIEKTKAIVLNSIKYGESQFIVDFFTETHGRLSFLVRFPKSAKGKMKRQYFQPLMLLDIEFDYRQRLQLQKLQNVGIASPLVGIFLDPVKTSLSFFLAEFLSYATRCEQANQPLFDFVYRSILWLDAAQRPIPNFHIVFLIRLSLFLGFAPNIEIGESGGYFDLVDGCFVAQVPAHSHFLSAEDSRQFVQILRLRYQTMHLYPMSRQERNHCVEVIIEYYKLHIPNFPELKSFPVLQELFG